MLWWWHSDVLLPPNENFVNNSVNSVDKNRHPRGCDDSPIFITPATSLVVCDVFPAFNCFPERPSRRPDAQKHSQGISWIPAHGREKLWAWIGLFFSDPGTGVKPRHIWPLPFARLWDAEWLRFPPLRLGQRRADVLSPLNFLCAPILLSAILNPILSPLAYPLSVFRRLRAVHLYYKIKHLCREICRTILLPDSVKNQSRTEELCDVEERDLAVAISPKFG